MDETAGEMISRKTRFKEAAKRGLAVARERLLEYRYELVVFCLIAAVSVVFMLPWIYHTIPAGNTGVLWKRFGGGTVTDHVYDEGFVLTYPWDKLFLYDTRLQMFDRDIEVLSSDGLKIKLSLVWRFYLLPQNVGYLHQFIGPNYADTMVTPTVGARARDVIAVYLPEEVYTESRLKIQSQILESVRYELLHHFNPPGDAKHEWLVMEDVLIRSMVLPEGVQEAIVRKNAMYHEMQEYSYRVQREQKEAERKRVEAVGIRNFQEIVSNGMSDAYLRWRGIEATLELAKSPNAKVVVVGNAKNGLPLILNTDSKDMIDGQGTDLHPKAASRPAPAEHKAIQTK